MGSEEAEFHEKEISLTQVSDHSLADTSPVTLFIRTKINFDIIKKTIVVQEKNTLS